MEQETTPDTALSAFGTLISEIETFGFSLLLPSRLTQLVVIVGVFLVAHLAMLFFAPRFHNWMRGLEGRPKWQLRWLLVVHRRIRLIFFVVLTWSVIFFMREVLHTFPSRTYLLSLIGTMSVAWLFIAFVGRLIHNTLIRRTVVWGGWIYAALYYFGFLETTSSLLENLAIEFGDFRLSVFAILKALFVTGILFFIARVLSSTTARKIGENEDISPSMRVLAVKFIQMALFSAAFFLGLKAVGFDLTGLAVLSGAVGVGLGFGLQKVVSNLVSGVIILLDKSIKPGDVISLGETFGWIDSLGARYVSVVTRNGKEYLIPNEDLITGQVVNWSHSNDFVRLDIFFGTSYGCDPHNVRKVAIDAAKGVSRVLSSKAPVCHIVGFGDSSVDYILRFWIKDPTGGLTNIRGNVYLALWDAFQEHGISIPFPQREVRVLGNETMSLPDD
ncbi:mechanosensitive ion channel family protein [Cochlodiniinecator piscidefendens]|uniref:mechanosensitive ion channel family protein n=1 Tax=Cochlodiniinecator piscidefendens TaxID=2715756 RepID=UPI00140BDD92|nr:mechanosensitive ion channel domain-containing protein [Cochlodiniinecator piscidefendens]